MLLPYSNNTHVGVKVKRKTADMPSNKQMKYKINGVSGQRQNRFIRKPHIYYVLFINIAHQLPEQYIRSGSRA